MSLVEALSRREIVIVTGKGGVGKSTVACALATLLAASGRSTVLLEVDPRESAHQMLDVPPSGGEVVAASARLFLQNLRPRDVVDRLVRERVPLAVVSRRILASPVYRSFVDGAPGVKECAVLAHALGLIHGGSGKDGIRCDVVVLDAPATGHGVSMLAAPGLVSDVVRGGPFGRMASDLAKRLADPEVSGVVVVTLAEEMPVREATWLLGILRERFSRDPDAVVVNGLYPRVPSRQVSDQAEEVVSFLRARRRMNDREIDRLGGAWRGRRLEVPLVPMDRGPELVAVVAEHLGAGTRR